MVDLELPSTSTDFVGLEELASQLGNDPATIRRRLRQDGRTLFTNPADHRRRLVKVEDAIWLRLPRPTDDEEVCVS